MANGSCDVEREHPTEYRDSVTKYLGDEIDFGKSQSWDAADWRSSIAAYDVGEYRDEHHDHIHGWVEGLNKYGDNLFTVDDLAVIGYSAVINREPTPSDFTWLKKKTSLVPPTLDHFITEEDIDALIPKKSEPPYVATHPKLMKVALGIFTDDEFIEVFAPRCKLDLALRRARSTTVFASYARAGLQDLWLRWIPCCVNLDYITVCNVMLFELVHRDFIVHFHKAGGLRSLDNLQMQTKTLSDHLKKHPCDMTLRNKYCEGGGIGGYRNQAPGDNFDFFAESHSLAEGGEQHGLPNTEWLAIFTKATIDVQGRAITPHVPYMSLRDFIASGMASTTGASSFGKVEWQFEGESGKFKARKNFLLDITTPEYLAEQTMFHLGKQVNVSFIKSELGKMRLAVTGDIWSYFSQAWLNYLCAGVYLKWPGNTLDETVPVQTERMDQMLDATMSGYSLPFDFRGFDHQPTTDEEQIQVGHYIETGRSNVPQEHVAEWELICAGTVDSFANASMVATQGGRTEKIKILGGVESGIRFTSVCGNYWNNTMTKIAKEMVAILCKELLRSWLRGDDSAIFAKNYWLCLLMRLAYAAINAIGNDSKYGILLNNSEFLRIWYGQGRCWGYVNRAIPGIMQRKPWASEPWDPEGVIRAQFDSIDIIERRGGYELTAIRAAVTRDWSRIRKQDARWLRLPAAMGGLGILPFLGWVSTTRWPQPDRPVVQFSVLPGSESLYQARFADWTLTSAEAKFVQQEEMGSKAGTDDVRGIGKVFREVYSQAIAAMPITKWERFQPKRFPIEVAVESRFLASIDAVANLPLAIADKGPGFGCARKLEKWWGEAKIVARVRKVSLKKMLDDKDPEVAAVVKRLCKMGLHRANAYDYVFGRMAGVVSGKLHPMLLSPVSSALSRLMVPSTPGRDKWDRETWSWFQATVGTALCKNFYTSALSQRLFLW